MKKIVCGLLAFLCGSFLFGQGALAFRGVEYDLPYPGILPDSPVYFLKVARDNLFLALLREEKQQAFYYLFLSDKRLAAGQMLIRQGKKDLGATTILKAQEYFRQATNLAEKVNYRELTEKLIVAGMKHLEVIESYLFYDADLMGEKVQKAYSWAQEDQERVRKLLLVN